MKKYEYLKVENLKEDELDSFAENNWSVVGFSVVVTHDHNGCQEVTEHYLLERKIKYTRQRNPK